MSGWEVIAMALSDCPLLGDGEHERRVPAAPSGRLRGATARVRDLRVLHDRLLRKGLDPTMYTAPAEDTSARGEDWGEVLRATTAAGRAGEL